ncbi:MAG TPA: MoaD/ThiS family protein [Marmoricola sp.]|nr:MoaD/ThiS family protein [Marmoricola sp.]
MSSSQAVIVRYWASARAAAGVPADELPVSGTTTLAAVLDSVRTLHPGRLADVLQVCSFLVGDRPVGTTEPADVLVEPGQTIELLPPFAGG